MYRGKSIAVVVPAYNVSALVGRVIETMPGLVDKIIVVNDKSSDDTSGVVRGYAASQGDRLVLIEHEQNQGVGGAISTGYRWARDHQLDITAVMAGDAQMEPADLPSLLAPLVDGAADYTKGNRLFTGDAWKIIPRTRYLGNSALSLLTKIASGYWHVADSQSGYTAATLKVLRTIDLDSIYKRYGMPNDMLVKLNVFNFRVADIPIRPVYNIGEKSGIRIRHVLFTLSFLLLKLFLWRMKEKYVIRDFHPLVFFYLAGAFSLLTGCGLGLYLVALRCLGHGVAPTSALFSAMLTISGVQFTLFAMWFDMEYNRHLRC